MSLARKVAVLENRAEKLIYNNSLGSLIKRNRIKKGMSLRELARIVGMSNSYLSQLENNHNNRPDVEIMRKLSNHLEINFVKMLISADYLSKLDVKEYINYKI